MGGGKPGSRDIVPVRLLVFIAPETAPAAKSAITGGVTEVNIKPRTNSDSCELG